MNLTSSSTPKSPIVICSSLVTGMYSIHSTGTKCVLPSPPNLETYSIRFSARKECAHTLTISHSLSLATREVFKIVLLAVGGAKNQPRSGFYDPEMFFNMTLSGELFLIDLLEKLGLEVEWKYISPNDKFLGMIFFEDGTFPIWDKGTYTKGDKPHYEFFKKGTMMINSNIAGFTFIAMDLFRMDN